MPLQNAIDVPTNAINPQLTNLSFKSNPVMSAQTGGVAAVTINTTNQWSVGNGYIFECYNNTVATNIGPIITSTGLNIDHIGSAASKIIEITRGVTAGSPDSFVAGTSAAFYVQATFNINTLADVTDLFIGFRKAQAYQNTGLTTYTDYATIGVHSTAGEIQLQTQIASGGNTVTDTTQAILAATNFTIRVNVSSAGVVTYLLNGAAPTTVAAYTLAANTVVPFIWYATPAGGHAEVDIVNYQCGLQ
jgi:hypothetical protein